MKSLWPLPVLFLLLASPLRAGEQEGSESGTPAEAAEDEAPAQEEPLAPPEGEGSAQPSEEPQPQGGAEANSASADGEAAAPEEKPVKEKEEPLISVKPASADGEEYAEEEGIEVAEPKKKVVATATLRKAPAKGKPAKAVKKAGKMAPPPVLNKKKAPLVAAEPPRPPAPAVPLTPITPRNP